MNPEEFLSGKRISQGLESDHTARQAPIVFMRCPRRRCLFQRHPARFSLSTSHASAICQSAQTDMQLLRAKAGWTNLSEILQLKQDFAVGSFAITVDHGLAFFVVFRQRPRRDGLNVASTKSRTAVGVKELAAA